MIYILGACSSVICCFKWVGMPSVWGSWILENTTVGVLVVKGLHYNELFTCGVGRQMAAARTTRFRSHYQLVDLLFHPVSFILFLNSMKGVIFFVWLGGFTMDLAPCKSRKLVKFGAGIIRLHEFCLMWCLSIRSYTTSFSTPTCTNGSNTR